jgi:DNA polymerase-1
LFDADLSGADAQVVAWEANEEALKSAFKAGIDIHNFNGKRIWGANYDPKLIRRKLTWRDECKRGVHGTNYISGPRNLARALGWPLTEVYSFQNVWFGLNPGIKSWQQKTDHQVTKTNQISNIFGYRIIYFDRPQNLLPKALAWVPQSTVAIICSRGAVRVHRNLPWCQILLQVHDSVVFQIPNHLVTPANLASVLNHLTVEAPYKPEPLIIPWSLKSSQLSWGDCGDKLDWATLEPLKKAA